MAFDLDIFVNKVDTGTHFVATYFLEAKKDLKTAAYELAVGQSIGNPNARNDWETPEMVENHCAKILNDGKLQGKSGIVRIAFPLDNIDFDNDGIAHLLCMLMGGQMDIDNIVKCHLIDVEIPKGYFQGPNFGMTGLRRMSKCFNKPLFGGIVKPKTGINSDQLLDMVKQMVDGGVNFIKEDEILGNPFICPFDERVEKINNYIENEFIDVVYTACVNGGPSSLMRKVAKVKSFGNERMGVHANVWCGFGTYQDIREYHGVFQHFQKSGDKTFTNKNHDFHVNWHVICKLVCLAGVDTGHCGMWGGYLSDSEDDLRKTLKIFRDANAVPALSCGMTADLIPKIAEKFGIDFMANVGGAIHSDPNGTTAGALKIRNAIDSL